MTLFSGFFPLWILRAFARAACLLFLLPAHLIAQRPEAKDLFGPRLLTRVELSPDGTRLAGTGTWDKDIGGLLVLDLATNGLTALNGFESLDIYQAFWHGNDRLLFNVSQDNLYSIGLYSTPADQLGRYIPIRLFDAMELVGQPVARPKNVIIWVRKSAENKGAPGPLLELDARRSVEKGLSGLRISETAPDLSHSIVRTLPMPEGPVLGFESDIDGDLALAFVLRGGEVAWHFWDHDTASWKSPPVWRAGGRPLARDPDRDYVWIVTRDAQQGSQLRRMGLNSGFVESPVLEDKRYDLERSELLFSKLTRELVGVRLDRQRNHTHWLSEKFATIQRTLDASLPAEEDHRIVDWDDAETRFVVHSTGTRQAGVFHVFDAGDQSLKRVGEAIPALVGKTFASTASMKFTARDGLPLEGYVTLPPNASKDSPSPLIVLPHGGPRARDDYTFDPEVQFLASLGYVVLQPNYRGSAGYLWPENASDFLADYGAMRDDVIDATRAALRTGYCDPKRVAIMGGSFGGYLALACSVEEPSLYRCAVSVCGVFDWAEHVKSKRRVERARPGEYETLLHRLGDPERDRIAYDAISPLARLDRLEIPMLVAHGKEDSIVSVKQSRLLAKALKKRGLPHETFYRPLAGHGFFATKDRLEFYQTLERFLVSQLAPATP